jgi:hypothetical protein
VLVIEAFSYLTLPSAYAKHGHMVIVEMHNDTQYGAVSTETAHPDDKMTVHLYSCDVAH